MAALEGRESTSDALPAVLDRLLRREDFEDRFESGRCAHEVGVESDGGLDASLSLDALLDLLDSSSSVGAYHECGSATAFGENARGVDFELGRCVSPTAWERFDGVAATRASLAAEALEAGFSLTIRHAELRSKAIAAAALALQDALGAPVQANVYVTPPRSRCAKPHVDQHCVYAWQLGGAKRWSLPGSQTGAFVSPFSREALR